jgi:4-hydroxy-4-methyl-2-oxoglutarate aldolase
MLGAVPPGHVAVYQTEDQTSAHLGELSVTSMKTRGCVGAVIDGGCRDVEFILREGFPVFARFTTPQDCVPRWGLAAHGDVTIEIGGVAVAQGD